MDYYISVYPYTLRLRSIDRFIELKKEIEELSEEFEAPSEEEAALSLIA